MRSSVSHTETLILTSQVPGQTFPWDPFSGSRILWAFRGDFRRSCLYMMWPSSSRGNDYCCRRLYGMKKPFWACRTTTQRWSDLWKLAPLLCTFWTRPDRHWMLCHQYAQSRFLPVPSYLPSPLSSSGLFKCYPQKPSLMSSRCWFLGLSWVSKVPQASWQFLSQRDWATE